MTGYGLPAGLLAFAGAGSGAGQGAFGALGGALQAFGQSEAAQARQADSEMQRMVEIARMEQQISQAQQQQALQQRQMQEEARRRQAYVQSLPQEQQALGNFAPDVLAKKQAEAMFAGKLTEDQRVDNELARAKFLHDTTLDRQKFAFEQQKHAVTEQQRADAVGKFKPESAKFYIGQVGKLNKELDSAAARYESATKSLKAGTATGDKAALMHMARLISDEALQEADVQRMVSEGVMPSWFESGWNALAGKSALEPQTRADMLDQLGREMTARHGAYAQNMNYLAGSIAPEIIPSERARVLGQVRDNPVQQQAPVQMQSSNPADYSDEQLRAIIGGG